MRIALRIAPIFILLASLQASPAAADFAIDAYTSPFPSNPCLHANVQPVLFIGPYCDGASCPPDDWAGCEHGYADQIGVAGVLAGSMRHAEVHGIAGSSASLRIRPETQRIEFVTDDLRELWGTLIYFGQPNELSLDFVAMGVEAVSFDVAGDLSAGSPLFVSIYFVSNGPYPSPSAGKELTLTAPGKVTIPLSAFDHFNNGNAFADVDYVFFDFGDCNVEGCTPYGGPRSVSFSPLTIHQTPTPAAAQSWGAVKSRYR